LSSFCSCGQKKRGKIEDEKSAAKFKTKKAAKLKTLFLDRFCCPLRRNSFYRQGCHWRFFCIRQILLDKSKAGLPDFSSYNLPKRGKI
jgi:hypothetical protein